ncbi:hypothetical protein [uncultured Maribacter sp.]|uniref:hypothetical protein n=1 Tax=uncultured Maribacter sp. TaxID=431308 RepID=UPI00260BAA3E|nr:hypothetical protein [uncultured Maribacter sp.]
MGLYEYMMLTEDEQWNDLWQIGIFLPHHTGHKEKFSLYALYDFFVEVELDLNTNKMIAKGHFKTGETLDKYAGDIYYTLI